MHRTTVVTENEAGVSKPVSELEGTGFSREVGNGGVEGLGNGFAGFDISGAT